jgi:hypothetical protein
MGVVFMGCNFLFEPGDRPSQPGQGEMETPLDGVVKGGMPVPRFGFFYWK